MSTGLGMGFSAPTPARVEPFSPGVVMSSAGKPMPVQPPQPEI